MNERIKKIRKCLGLTQQEFADRLGIKRGAIANYEIGRNVPIDAVVSLICREFNVNREWLVEGTGEMFVSVSSYDTAYNRFGYLMENGSASKKAALAALLALLYSVPDDTWEDIVRQYEQALRDAREN